MPRSLADLKAKPKSLPTRTVRICLDQEAVADVQRLDAEKADILLDANRGEVDENGERKGPARRLGEGAQPPRVAEIDAEMAALFDRMRESEGDLLLRAIDGGAWQRFKDEHPAREGNKSDEDTTYGLCDSTALLENLGRFVAAWDGENLAVNDWAEWFAAQVAPADLRELCSEVVQLHEARVRVPPKPSSASSGTQPNGSASPSQSASESLRDDSSAGSQRSDTSTTTPTGV
jgi:hypothetical protein